MTMLTRIAPIGWIVVEPTNFMAVAVSLKEEAYALTRRGRNPIAALILTISYGLGYVIWCTIHRIGTALRARRCQRLV
jgi:hypothetical protein